MLTGLQDTHNVRYLDNSETDVGSYSPQAAPGALKIWGSPWTPFYQSKQAIACRLVVVA